MNVLLSAILNGEPLFEWQRPRRPCAGARGIYLLIGFGSREEKGKLEISNEKLRTMFGNF